MKLLLINQNPVVSRMMKMSVPKAGFEIEECGSVYDLPKGSYDVIIIDDEMYDDNFLKAIQENISYKKLGLLTSSKESEKDTFDFLIPKPFLPTDLVEILRDVKASIEQEKDTYIDELAHIKKEESEERKENTKITQEEFLGEEPEEKESIVEIEEQEEESPFIEEPLTKSGILNKEEIESVSKLLEEEATNIEKSEELAQEPLAPLLEEESIEELHQEQLEPIEEIKESLQEMSQEEKQEEKKEEEPAEEELEAVQTPTNTPIIEENEEKTPSHKTQLQELGKNLDIAALKELLDGMKIDISITISFPDKKDV